VRVETAVRVLLGAIGVNVNHTMAVLGSPVGCPVDVMKAATITNLSHPIRTRPIRLGFRMKERMYAINLLL